MTTATVGLKGVPVGAERKKPEDKQITFRLSGELHSRLNATADGMSIDVTSLLRMMIRKHLPEFEQLAAENRERERRLASEDV